MSKPCEHTDTTWWPLKSVLGECPVHWCKDCGAIRVGKDNDLNPDAQGDGWAIPRVPFLGIEMRLTCPECGTLHIDEGEFATKLHHTHACQHCGMVWRPAVVPTLGVAFLPGFKNEDR